MPTASTIDNDHVPRVTSDDVYIMAAQRSPVGKFNGALSQLPAHQVAGQVIASLLKGICGGGGEASSDQTKTEARPRSIDLAEVIVGQTLQAGQGQNPARQAAVRAGVPIDVPAYSINMVCGSGLKAVAIGFDRLRSNAGDQLPWLIAGGMERMSGAAKVHATGANVDKVVSNGVGGDSNTRLIDTMLHDGLTDAFESYHMGITAENIVERYAITRQEQDQYALESQRKHAAAVENKSFNREITPILAPGGETDQIQIVFDSDEHPRHKVTSEQLAKLKPVFKQIDGTVSAGNSSGLNDGAAFLLLCRWGQVCCNGSDLGVKPMARIVGWHQVAMEPSLMGLAPIGAVKGLLGKLQWTPHSVALYELNEAFAAQSIACLRDLQLPLDRVNVNGGAIAIGHPLGASGARVLVTLTHSLASLDLQQLDLDPQIARPLRGVAALCVGGGMGIAMAIELC